MPFARLLALLLLTAAPAAHAQRGLVARSYAEADTTQGALLRAFVSTADSIGAAISLDSASVGVLRARRGATTLRVVVTKGTQRSASVLATADFGDRMPDEANAGHVQLRWVRHALRALFGDDASGQAQVYSLVALDANVPFCAAPDVRPDPDKGDRWPVPASQVQPVYPDDARRRGLEAYVMVQATISETGRVTCAGAVSAMAHGFSDAAVLAVSKWTFTPAVVDGQPVAVVVSVPIRFRTRR